MLCGGHQSVFRGNVIWTDLCPDFPASRYYDRLYDVAGMRRRTTKEN